MNEYLIRELEAAYAKAPSAALAKVIVLAWLDGDRIEGALQYLPGLELPLEENEALRIAAALVENDFFAQALPLLDASQPAHAGLLARCQARLAPADPADSGTAPAERPRLRVVEKTDFATVTDMARYKEQTTTFADVVGLAEVKKQISKKIIMPFQRPSLFQRFKKKVGGGVLLYGPPGCGKTLIARATAGECNASFYNIAISDVLDMYIGESEQKLHAIFEKAREKTPSVIFFDELEALAGKREHSRNSATSNVVSQFLAELDGFSQNNEGVLVLAATNVPWSIDAAFLRPGRFDRMFFVPPPDKEARASIVEHHMKGRPVSGAIDYDLIARKTPGYSGADLAHLVEMAADEAIDESIQAGSDAGMGMHHFQEALGQSRATTTEWLTTARNYARYANDGGRYDDVLEFLKKHGK